jgi:AraC family ethanolamine operon transcriptional activator
MISSNKDIAQPFMQTQFNQIDEFCQQVRLWDLDFRPLAKPSERQPNAHLVQAATRSIHYAYCRLTTTIDQRGTAPPGMVTFVVKDEGMGRLWWRNLDTASDHVLVYKLGTEVCCVSSASFSIHTLSATPDTLERLSHSMRVRHLSERVMPEVFHIDARELNEIRADLRMFRDGIGFHSAASLEQLLGSLLRSWLAAANTSVSSRPSLRARDRAVKRCLEYLAAADLPNVFMEELRTISDVSERTLEYAFQERFGMSPAKFLKAKKLVEVHRALSKDENAQKTIIDIAAEHGFWHHSHFTEDIKRLFGEMPSRSRCPGGLPSSE